jgi:hypothetical protein
LDTPVLIVNNETTHSQQSTYEPSSSVRLWVSIFVYPYNTSHTLPPFHKPILEPCYSSIHYNLPHAFTSFYILHTFTSMLSFPWQGKKNMCITFPITLLRAFLYTSVCTTIRAFNTQNVGIKKWNGTPYFHISPEKAETVVTSLRWIVDIL